VPGCILWLTGPPGSGKTTIGRRLRAKIPRSLVEVLDGDEIRLRLFAELGYSRADRDNNVDRTAFVARMLARNGVLVIVCLVSPYADARDDARAAAEAEGIPFVLVHVDAPLAVLEERDPKGHYRKARAGALKAFTGVSDPYETPEAPELALRTDLEDPEQSASAVLGFLQARGYVPMSTYEI